MLVLLYPVGYAGLVLAPVAGAWLWAVVIGTATATFPVALTLIGLRARTSAGTAALSGFTQSVGYLIAAVGPFGVGVLHDLTGGWTVPLVTLAVSLECTHSSGTTHSLAEELADARCPALALHQRPPTIVAGR